MPYFWITGMRGQRPPAAASCHEVARDGPWSAGCADWGVALAAGEREADEEAVLGLPPVAEGTAVGFHQRAREAEWEVRGTRSLAGARPLGLRRGRAQAQLDLVRAA